MTGLYDLMLDVGTRRRLHHRLRAMALFQRGCCNGCLKACGYNKSELKVKLIHDYNLHDSHVLVSQANVRKVLMNNVALACPHEISLHVTSSTT